MKMSVKHYRVAVLNEMDVIVAAGLDQDSGKPDQVMAALREKFGPLLPGIKFFWPGGHHCIVGLPCLSFDVPEVNIPTAGLVLADPLDAVRMHRLDGEICGELSRLGIHTTPESYEFRCAYELKGN